ncbi:nucleoside phosphorylase [Nitritalea halalkaliphila]|uniref:nucleoside phosphorylase n=1 Tax=Nitritalea halalkaliphila TaxID=590849 RepID=UPI0002DB9B6B|nr:nucleoside phosphorylase [Nitritalea halalkaliphila]
MSKIIPASELILNADGSIYHLNLKPENLASTVLTVGDPERVEKVSQYFDTLTFKTSKREFNIHSGTYKGTPLTVMSTGMGTDNIEIVMNELDALVNIDLKTRREKEEKKSLSIIRIGTSGSMQSDVPVDAHLASAFAVGLDTLMHFYTPAYTEQEENLRQRVADTLQIGFTPYAVGASRRLLQKIGANMLTGVTATCPGFYGPQGRSLRLVPAIPTIIEKLSQTETGIAGLRLTNFEMETAGYYAMGRLLGHEMLSVNAIVANRVEQVFSQDSEKVVDSLIREVLKKVAE